MEEKTKKSGVKGGIVFILIILAICIAAPAGYFLGNKFINNTENKNVAVENTNTNETVTEEKTTEEVIMPEIIYPLDSNRDQTYTEFNVNNVPITITYKAETINAKVTVNNKEIISNGYTPGTMILMKDIIVIYTNGSDGTETIYFVNLNGDIIKTYSGTIMGLYIDYSAKPTLEENKIVFTIGATYICTGDKNCLLTNFSNEYTNYTDIIKANVEFEYDGENTGMVFNITNPEYMNK